MAFIRPAFAIAAARSYLFSSPISFSSCSFVVRDNARSIRPFASLSIRNLCAGVNHESETEDLRDWCARKKNIAPGSKYLRYRKGRGLYVTNLTDTGRNNKSRTKSRKAGTDCDKEKEKETMKRMDTNGTVKLAILNGARHFLFNGQTHQPWVEKQFTTNAMKAGTARHKELANEVVQRIKGRCKSKEDKWAKKLAYIIMGINRFLDKGLTREQRVIGLVCGAWIIGSIDEISMSKGVKPKLVDTKTRVKNTIPSETEIKNDGRLQLMIYKLLWDKLVSEEFPLEQFCAFYKLDPDKDLSEEIRTGIADAGVPEKTLRDVVRYMESKCKMMQPADNMMILRYEWQEDKSLIEDVEFEFNPVRLKNEMEHNLGFWLDGQKPRWRILLNQALYSSILDKLNFFIMLTSFLQIVLISKLQYFKISLIFYKFLV